MAMLNSAGSSTPSPSAKVWPPQSSQDSSGTVSGAAQRTPELTMSSPSASRASRAKRSVVSVRILSCPTGGVARRIPAGSSSGRAELARMRRTIKDGAPLEAGARFELFDWLRSAVSLARRPADGLSASWVTRSSRSSHSTTLS